MDSVSASLSHDVTGRALLARDRVLRFYIARETCIGVAINIGFAAAFSWWQDHAVPETPLWGPHGLALNLLEGTVMVTLLSSLVTTHMAEQAPGLAHLAGSPHSTLATLLPTGLLWRLAALIGLIALILPAVTLTMLALAGCHALPFRQVLLLKMGYYAMLALMLTPLVITRAVSARRRRESSFSGDPP